MSWKSQRRAEREADYEMKRAREDEKRRQAADDAMMSYPLVSERLQELGIDPFELRDYLKALP